MSFLIHCSVSAQSKSCLSKACFLIDCSGGLCMRPLTDRPTVQPSEWMAQSILSSREADEHNSHSSPTARCDEVSGGLVSRPLGLMMTGVTKLKARSAAPRTITCVSLIEEIIWNWEARNSSFWWWSVKKDGQDPLIFQLSESWLDV